MWRMAGWAGGAVLLLYGGVAAAGQLGCAASFDDRPSIEIDQYGPGTAVQAKVTVTNLDSAAPSVATRIDAVVLQGAGGFGAPLALDPAQTVERSASLTVASYLDCLTLAARDGSADDRLVAPVTVAWDGGAASCSAELICRPPLAQRSASVTRPPGFFSVREAPLQACLDQGPISLGDVELVTINDALGLLWAGPAKYADDTDRSARDRAWLLLARQTLAATCNARLFGAAPADPALLTGADDALSSDACARMDTLRAELERFNDSGAWNALPAGFEAGEPSPVNAKAIAQDPTRASPDGCSGGTP